MDDLSQISLTPSEEDIITPLYHQTLLQNNVVAEHSYEEARQQKQLLDTALARADRFWYNHLVDLFSANRSVVVNNNIEGVERLRPGFCIIARDYPGQKIGDGNKQYALIGIRDLFDALDGVPEPSRVWYFMFLPNMPLDIVMDVDVTDPTHPAFFRDDVLGNLRLTRIIVDLFNKWAKVHLSFGDGGPNENDNDSAMSPVTTNWVTKCVALESSTTKKRSLHLHIQGPGTVFRDVGDTTRAIYGFVSWLYECSKNGDRVCQDLFIQPNPAVNCYKEPECVIDCAATNQKRLMRTLNSHKLGKEATFGVLSISDREFNPETHCFDKAFREVGCPTNDSKAASRHPLARELLVPLYNPVGQKDSQMNNNNKRKIITYIKASKVPYYNGFMTTDPTMKIGSVGFPLVGDVKGKGKLFEGAVLLGKDGTNRTNRKPHQCEKRTKTNTGDEPGAYDHIYAAIGLLKEQARLV